MKSKYRKIGQLIALGVATLPLMQVACTTDALAQSFAFEVTSAAAQFVYEASQTIFMNVLGL